MIELNHSTTEPKAQALHAGKLRSRRAAALHLRGLERQLTQQLQALPIGSERSRRLFALRAAIRERIDDPNVSAAPAAGGVA